MKQLSLVLLLLMLSCSKKDHAPEPTVELSESKLFSRFSVTFEIDTLLKSPQWSHDIVVADSVDTVIWSVMGLDADGEKFLRSRFHKTNRKEFGHLRPYHQKALETFFETYSDLSEISFASAGFYNYDQSWAIPVAIASSENSDYQDYRTNYPNSRLTGLNQLFVELATETNAFVSLDSLFREFGYRLELLGCEKVFAQKVKELSIADTLISAGLSAEETVIYDAGMVDFSVTKIE